MLKLLNKDQVLWNKSYHHPEIVAGMIAASISILPKDHILSTDTDIKQYRLKTGITLDSLDELTDNSLNDLDKNWKALWVRSYNNGYFDLYKFKTSHFIQGIITFCNSANIDFRDVIHMPIFDSNQITYTLNGYQIYPNEMVVATVNSNDEEIEQQDNENILEVGRKDY